LRRIDTIGAARTSPALWPGSVSSAVQTAADWRQQSCRSPSAETRRDCAAP